MSGIWNTLAFIFLTGAKPLLPDTRCVFHTEELEELEEEPVSLVSRPHFSGFLTIPALFIITNKLAVSASAPAWEYMWIPS